MMPGTCEDFNGARAQPSSMLAHSEMKALVYPSGNWKIALSCDNGLHPWLAWMQPEFGSFLTNNDSDVLIHNIGGLDEEEIWWIIAICWNGRDTPETWSAKLARLIHTFHRPKRIVVVLTKNQVPFTASGAAGTTLRKSDLLNTKANLRLLLGDLPDRRVFVIANLRRIPSCPPVSVTRDPNAARVAKTGWDSRCFDLLSGIVQARNLAPLIDHELYMGPQQDLDSVRENRVWLEFHWN